MRVVPRSIIKAGRALLSWTQRDLAMAIKSDVATVARYESGAGMHDDTMSRIIDKFEESGIEIIFHDDVAVGVRFVKAEDHIPR
jgi:ribosome-binding protein aMBF1 (putative translation factor)